MRGEPLKPWTPALETPCQNCNGTGRVENRQFTRWLEQRREALRLREANPNLPVELPRPPHGLESSPCPVCREKGGVPNELGSAILSFVKRHLMGPGGA